MVRVRSIVAARSGPRSPRRARVRMRVPVLAVLTVLAAVATVGVPAGEVSPPAVTAATVDLTDPGQLAAPGWSGEADVDPELVGIEWQGDPQAEFTIETRDESGLWVEAGIVEAQPRDEGPDDDSADAVRVPATNVSEPLWVGEGVTGVRVRLDDASAEDVELHAVDSPPAGAPEGSAVADGGPILVGPGSGPAVRSVASGALAIFALGLVFTRRAAARPRGRLRAVVAVVVASLVIVACVPEPPPPPPPPAPATQVPAPDKLITRAGWGANESLRTANCPGGPDYMAAVKFAVVHHTVNSNTYSASQGPQLVRGIYAYHTQSLGYCDIAYNFLVDRYGNVYEGRYGGTGRAVMGAHARGFNTSSTGVAIIGDFRTAVPPAAAMTALQQVLAWKLSMHEVNPKVSFQFTTTGNEKFAPNTTVTLAPITYHRFTGNTECPGKQVIDRIGQIRNGVAQRMGYP